jgi:Phosphate-selective porin O and P
MNKYIINAKTAVTLFAVFATFCGHAQSAEKTEPPKKKNWYETFQIRGYSQIRYNRLLETNNKYKNEQGDRSIGKDGGFSIRRTRLIIQGNIREHVFLYIQPDFANTLSGTTNTH